MNYITEKLFEERKGVKKNLLKGKSGLKYIYVFIGFYVRFDVFDLQIALKSRFDES